MRSAIEEILKEALGSEYVPGTVEVQGKEEFGHYTTPIAMRLAKEAEMQPRVVAEGVKDRIEKAAPEGFFEKVEVAGSGFVNIWLADDVTRKEFEKISKDKRFGLSSVNKGKKVIVEYSSPNVAKAMHAGHLRNNSLGEALARLHAATGYKVVRWNYVGDWGTQFGKIIAAYKLWGSKLKQGENFIAQLEDLYLRFNKAAKEDAELESKGKEEFRKLEGGDRGNRKLWKKFCKASLAEMRGIYKRFNIGFDQYIGESFFEDELSPLVKDLVAKGLAERSEGALIIKLDDLNLPPALVQKSDGTSLYITRDIAALEYRARKYKPDRLLYVIGNEQTLQFQQLFAIAGMMNIAKGVDLEHVKYGLLLGADGGKMSTREGTSITINDLANEAVNRALEVVAAKNSDMPKKGQLKIAEAVGVNALKYFMLSEGRTSDIRFDWDKILDFKGDSGPYLQYTYARLRRLVSKAGGLKKADLSELKEEHELRLMRKVFSLPDEVVRSVEQLSTNNLTEYLYQLANLANRFYEAEHILDDGNAGRRNARLLLADTAARAIAKGLELLGIEVLEAI
jgi:arginyl-tRNA synthetase